MIVVIRGAAEAVGLTAVLVDNSLVHYLAVCLLSFLAAAVIAWALARLRPPRPTRGRAWIQLDQDALAHNVSALRSLLPPGCQLMPAVKANAYGHGALPIARALAAQGISALLRGLSGGGHSAAERGHPRGNFNPGVYTP